MPFGAAWASLGALLLLTRAAAQDAYTGQTAVGQLPNDALAYFAGWPNPCLQPNASSGKVPPRPRPFVELAARLQERYLVTCLLAQICTRLSKGGPNNATYMSGFTFVLQGHQISAETNLQQASSNDLLGVSLLCKVPCSTTCNLLLVQWAKHAAGLRNALSRGCAHVVTADGKPLAHDPQPNHQNFTFPGMSSVQLQWSLQGNNQLPSVSVTSGARNTAPRLLTPLGPSRICSRLGNSHSLPPVCKADG